MKPAPLGARRRIASVLLAWLALNASYAFAEPLAPGAQASGAPIVIVRVPGDDPVVRRVRAELSAKAIRTVELSESTDLGGMSLPQLASAFDAQAVLRVEGSVPAAELWLVSTDRPEQGRTERLSVSDDPRNAPELLAVRITEALRMHALEASAGGAPRAASTPSTPSTPSTLSTPSTAVKPDPPVPAAASEEPVARAERALESTSPVDRAIDDSQSPRPPESRLWLELAPLVLGSPGGIGAQLGAFLEGRLVVHAPVSLSGFLVLPLAGEDLEASEGSASLWPFLVGAAVDLQLDLWPLELGFGAGLAGVLFATEGAASDSFAADGSAPAPLEGTEDLVPAIAPVARASVHFAIAGSVRLCARVHVGASAPEITVRFLERNVAHWGRPLLLASLGFELGL